MIVENCSHCAWALRTVSAESSVLLPACAVPQLAQRERQHYFQRGAALFPLLLFICTYSPMYCAPAFTLVFVFVFILLYSYSEPYSHTHIHTHSWVMCAKVAAALFDARIVVLPFDFCRQFTHILFISILLLFPSLAAVVVLVA